MSRVRKTHAARADLLEIANYIAHQSGQRQVAENYLRKLEKKLSLLASQPLMGQERPQFRSGEYRCFPVDDYVVYYKPLAEGILVVRVLHGARDHDLLFPK